MGIHPRKRNVRARRGRKMGGKQKKRAVAYVFTFENSRPMAKEKIQASEKCPLFQWCLRRGVERWGGYIFPGGNVKCLWMKGRTFSLNFKSPSVGPGRRWGAYIPPRRVKKNVNENNRVLWRGIRDRSFHVWIDSLAAWSCILLAQSSTSSKLFRLFPERIRHWQYLALAELRQR